MITPLGNNTLSKISIPGKYINPEEVGKFDYQSINNQKSWCGVAWCNVSHHTQCLCGNQAQIFQLKSEPGVVGYCSGVAQG